MRIRLQASECRARLETVTHENGREEQRFTMRGRTPRGEGFCIAVSGELTAIAGSLRRAESRVIELRQAQQQQQQRRMA